jgi:hypothetical protein
LRTATIVFGSSAEIRTRANRPRRRVKGATHGSREAVVTPLLLDQVRYHFRVRLCDERVTLRNQLALELEVVLNDAVVHHDDATFAVAVRVRVFFRGTAVCRPAGMPDAVFALERIRRDDIFQLRQLAGSPAQMEFAVADHRHAR